MATPMMTARAWDHTEIDKKGGASWKRVRLYGKQNMIMSQKMADAIEASFEADPNPHIEKIWCNIWCNTSSKKGQVQQWCNNKNGQKQRKTMQNKNSGKP